VVAVIDAFYFGSRRIAVEKMRLEDVPPRLREYVAPISRHAPQSAEWIAAVNRACGEYEHLTAKTIFSAGFTWPGIHVWDDRRVLEYLCSRPDVDSARIGALGLSIGGLRTAHLIAADPRVKAACVTGWMTEFPAQLRNHLRNHTWMIYIPGLYRALDLPDAAALTAPGALLVQQCGRDQLYPMEAMKGAVAKLERIYAKAGLRERFRGTFYDVPHSFNPEMQEEAFAWLEKWLNA
jgi:dienelactone hydrolase